MKLPDSSPPERSASASIAEVSLGRSHLVEPVSPGKQKVFVHTETPDRITQSPTVIVVIVGNGLLVYKDPTGTICGRKILESGSSTNLPTGTRYSYWDNPTNGIDLIVMEEYNANQSPSDA